MSACKWCGEDDRLYVVGAGTGGHLCDPARVRARALQDAEDACEPERNERGCIRAIRALATPAAERARLDADRTAEPKTKMVAHVPAGERIVGHSKVIDYELRDTPSAPVAEQDVERWAVEAWRALTRIGEHCRAPCDHPALTCIKYLEDEAEGTLAFAPAPIRAAAQRKETP